MFDPAQGDKLGIIDIQYQYTIVAAALAAGGGITDVEAGKELLLECRRAGARIYPDRRGLRPGHGGRGDRDGHHVKGPRGAVAGCRHQRDVGGPERRDDLLRFGLLRVGLRGPEERAQSRRGPRLPRRHAGARDAGELRRRHRLQPDRGRCRDPRRAQRADRIHRGGRREPQGHGLRVHAGERRRAEAVVGPGVQGSNAAHPHDPAAATRPATGPSWPRPVTSVSWPRPVTGASWPQPVTGAS